MPWAMLGSATLTMVVSRTAMKDPTRNHGQDAPFPHSRARCPLLARASPARCSRTAAPGRRPVLGGSGITLSRDFMSLIGRPDFPVSRLLERALTYMRAQLTDPGMTDTTT